MRSAIAVIAGFLLWTVIWLGVSSLISIAMPDSFNADGSSDSALILLILLVLSVICSWLSGNLVSHIKMSASMTPAWVLGLILLLVELFLQISLWTAFPIWYHIPFLGLLIPATILGARRFTAASA